MSDIDPSARNLHKRTPFHCSMDNHYPDSKFLYHALSSAVKSTMNTCDLRYDAVSRTVHSNMDHGGTAVLTLFERAPLELIHATFGSLLRRRQRRQTTEEVLICSSINMDGDSAIDLAARCSTALRSRKIRGNFGIPRKNRGLALDLVYAR